MKIFLTGAAGFIGFHTALHLLKRGDTVVGFDNLNAYYDPTLKEARLKILREKKGFSFIKGDILDRAALATAMRGADRVIHLAALAGVRYAYDHPEEYVDTNIKGFFNVIDEVRLQKIGGLIYASTSSVYGSNTNFPSSEEHMVDSQVSLYGMTKKSNENMAHVYHALYGTKVTGLRFFTVYGPYGRPDMALFLFTEKLLRGEKLPIFNDGKMQRDFTYVDDIVSGIVAAVDKNYDEEIFNLGCGKTEELMSYVRCVEKTVGMTATIEYLPMQKGDAVRSSADITKAERMLGYAPQTTIEHGVPRFIAWYREYYKK